MEPVGSIVKPCPLNSSMGQLLPWTLEGCIEQGKGALRASEAIKNPFHSPSHCLFEAGKASGDGWGEAPL